MQEVPLKFRSSPAVCVCPGRPGRIDLAIIGDNDAMYHKFWGPSGGSYQPLWTPSFEDLGAQFVSPPSIASWGPGRVDIFGIGMNKTVLHKHWNGSKWTPDGQNWEDLGGNMNSCVQAVSVKSGRIDLFVLGNENTLRHKVYPTWDFWAGLRIRSSILPPESLNRERAGRFTFLRWVQGAKSCINF
jgi:hypothetical protein